MRPTFETTMRWYNTMVNPAKNKKKQTTLHKYLKKSHSSNSSSSSSSDDAELTPSTRCSDTDALFPTAE